MKIYYATHVHELDRLVEIKNNNDAVVLARTTLWRQMKCANVFVFHGYDHGNGVMLIEIASIIEGNASVSYKDNKGGVV